MLIIRLALAAVFLSHGLAKLAHMDSTIGFFSRLNLSPFWAYLVAIVETAGGAAMLFGIFTMWAGILLALVMAGALYFFKFSVGFFGGAEFDLVLLLTALAVAFGGPGKHRLPCPCPCMHGKESMK